MQCCEMNSFDIGFRHVAQSLCCYNKPVGSGNRGEFINWLNDDLVEQTSTSNKFILSHPFVLKSSSEIKNKTQFCLTFRHRPSSI